MSFVTVVAPRNARQTNARVFRAFGDCDLHGFLLLLEMLQRAYAMSFNLWSAIHHT
jgi:hypothetical protein